MAQFQDLPRYERVRLVAVVAGLLLLAFIGMTWLNYEEYRPSSIAVPGTVAAQCYYDWDREEFRTPDSPHWVCATLAHNIALEAADPKKMFVRRVEVVGDPVEHNVDGWMNALKFAGRQPWCRPAEYGKLSGWWWLGL